MILRDEATSLPVHVFYFAIAEGISTYASCRLFINMNPFLLFACPRFQKQRSDSLVPRYETIPNSEIKPLVFGPNCSHCCTVFICTTGYGDSVLVHLSIAHGAL